MLTGRWIALALCASAGIAAHTRADWDTRFSPPGLRTGQIKDAVIYDDGNGPKLYVCGAFNQINGVPTRNIARWDGVKWEPVLAGISGDCRALAVYDADGPGGNPGVLVIGGVFTDAFYSFTSSNPRVTTRNIVAFDGSSWLSMGGLTGTQQWVNDIAVCDFGSGPRLIAGGAFTTAGSVSGFGNIAIWNGSAWSKLPSGSGATRTSGQASIAQIHAFNDGSGQAIFVTGNFEKLNNTTVTTGFAKFDGTAANGLGWVSPTAQTPWAVGSFDFDGAGPGAPELLISANTGAENTGEIHAWNGSTWRSFAGPNNKLANSITGFDGALHVTTDSVYRFDGTNWTLVASAFTSPPSPDAIVNLLTVVDVDLDGPNAATLFAGGSFRSTTTGRRVEGYAFLTAANAWDTLPIGEKWGVTGAGVITDLLLGDPDGAGPLGESVVFTSDNADSLVGPNATVDNAGPVRAFDGSAFTVLGNPPSFTCLTMLDLDGAGPTPRQLVGVDASGLISVWTGTAWEPAPGSIAAAPGPVYALTMFDPDGAGPLTETLTICGSFDGTPIGVLRWDGAAWVALGSGLTPVSGSVVRTLLVFDDGSGPALFAGGNFSATDGVNPLRIVAKFQNGVWSPLSTGTGLTSSSVDAPDVNDLAAFDADGSGPAPAKLVIGGVFNQIDSATVNASSVALWNGTALAPVGDSLAHGTSATAPPFIYDLQVFQVGSSPELLIAGNFKSNADTALRGVARLDPAGAAWTYLGDVADGGPSTINQVVAPNAICYAITARTEGNHAAYYIGGNFNLVGTTPAYGAARFTRDLPNNCPADFNGVGGVTIDDLFLYINAYFQGLNSADFNGVGGVTIDDLFLYINAYFVGC